MKMNTCVLEILSLSQNKFNIMNKDDLVRLLKKSTLLLFYFWVLDFPSII